MRALAEIAMRGRVHAIGVAVLGLLLPFFVWVSAAVVGLVALGRRGEDALVGGGWARRSACALRLWPGEPGPFAALWGRAVAAGVLHRTRSWPLALVAVVVTNLLLGFALNTLGAGFVARLVATL